MAALLLLFLFLFASSALSQDSLIGVNIGTEVTDMPSPTQVVTLLKSQNINRVRLYDADRSMLLAFAHTGIQLIISVPNDQLLGISQSNATAANWVTRNVAAYYPATNITAIAVGSEVLTSLPNAAPVLVSALKYIQAALVTANLDRQIKVSTPHASTIILDSFPPSRDVNRTFCPWTSMSKSIWTNMDTSKSVQNIFCPNGQCPNTSKSIWTRPDGHGPSKSEKYLGLYLGKN